MMKMLKNRYKKFERKLEEGIQISLDELRRELKERHYQPIYLRDNQGNIYLRAENRNMRNDKFYQILTQIDTTNVDAPQQIKLKRIEEPEAIEDIVHRTYPIFEISDFSAIPTPIPRHSDLYEAVRDHFVP